MKPRILTLAEVDDLIASDDAAEGMPYRPDLLPSVLRMARAIALQAERVAYTTNIVGDEWAVSVWPAYGSDARRAVTVGLVEAIEEATDGAT